MTINIYFLLTMYQRQLDFHKTSVLGIIINPFRDQKISKKRLTCHRSRSFCSIYVCCNWSMWLHITVLPSLILLYSVQFSAPSKATMDHTILYLWMTLHRGGTRASHFFHLRSAASLFLYIKGKKQVRHHIFI